ncbi:MAG: SMP-30/gluconolactonase/LRE family protein, partial [Oricola sp.]|nr:SMP-30/gluconolactonase/LRE family protein [Oricola sp.]
MTVECIWAAEALLGEGPVWCAREQALWFTDIKGGRLHRLDPASGSKSTFEVPGQPGFIVPSDDGSFLVGMGRKLCRFSGDEISETIAELDMDSRNRLNDGAVDAKGRLWFGSMDDSEQEETGAVYLFDGASVRPVGGVCPITNG